MYEPPYSTIDAVGMLASGMWMHCRGVKRKLTQAQLDAARRDREPTGRFKPAALDGDSPVTRVEFRGRITNEFEGGYVATVR